MNTITTIVLIYLIGSIIAFIITFLENKYDFLENIKPDDSTTIWKTGWNELPLIFLMSWFIPIIFITVYLNYKYLDKYFKKIKKIYEGDNQ